ncbi:hypothetical protein ACJ72_01764 [Emergomyces africanus]|uniref:Transcription initiation factor TFIID subunit 13 n=1 Tax=Emergomyces africanus TaxID=1955775 RepID=A0A1B7P496_9EURO|nr:hypothetical protein ACJ72_01764 [Emergomyces africanus]
MQRGAVDVTYHGDASDSFVFDVSQKQSLATFQRHHHQQVVDKLGVGLLSSSAPLRRPTILHIIAKPLLDARAYLSAMVQHQPPLDQKCIQLGDFGYLIQFPRHIRDHYELEHVLEPTEANPVAAEKGAPPFTKTDDRTKSTNERNSDHIARRKSRKLNTGMAEPRVRLTRHQGQLNFGNELRHLLHAYGDPAPHHSYPQEPLPETLRVLDEIVTDFIIETCHSAAQCATYSRRQKIKVDDFRFALRRDPVKLGRVQELFRIERELKEARRAFDQNDDRVGATGKKGLEELAESVVDGGDGSVAGATGTTAAGKKGKGKASTVMTTGKRGVDSIFEGGLTKKRKSAGGSVS